MKALGWCQLNKILSLSMSSAYKFFLCEGSGFLYAKLSFRCIHDEYYGRFVKVWITRMLRPLHPLVGTQYEQYYGDCELNGRRLPQIENDRAYCFLNVQLPLAIANIPTLSITWIDFLFVFAWSLRVLNSSLVWFSVLHHLLLICFYFQRLISFV